MIQLRPYQQQTISALRSAIKNNHKRIVLCLPTGGGKTIVFMYMVSEHLKRGGKALVVTDRIELLKQSDGALTKLGIEADLIDAGSKPDLTHNVHIGMIETISRRAETYSDFLNSRTLVILDECHLQTFNKLFPYLSDTAIVIGATATPFRDRDQTSLSEYYTDLVEGSTTQELIDLNYLSSADTYGVDVDLTKVKTSGGDYDTDSLGDMYSDNKVYRGVIENYNRLCAGKKALVFASNIKSSKELVAAAGDGWRHLDSYMPDWERKETLKWFHGTENAVLSNVGILTTGFDCPEVEAIILYRATKSLPLMQQMCGRGSRVTETKKKFLILDFGNNIKRHNFWESTRTWSLEKKPKGKAGVAPVKTCPKCGGLVPLQVRECTLEIEDVPCGYVWPPPKREDPEIIELKLLDKSAVAKLYHQEQGVEKLAKLCKLKLLNPFAVLHRLKTKEEGIKFVSLMGYKSSFVHVNKKRFKCFGEGGG